MKSKGGKSRMNGRQLVLECFDFVGKVSLFAGIQKLIVNP